MFCWRLATEHRTSCTLQTTTDKQRDRTSNISRLINDIRSVISDNEREQDVSTQNAESHWIDHRIVFDASCTSKRITCTTHHQLESELCTSATHHSSTNRISITTLNQILCRIFLELWISFQTTASLFEELCPFLHYMLVSTVDLVVTCFLLFEVCVESLFALNNDCACAATNILCPPLLSVSHEHHHSDRFACKNECRKSHVSHTTDCLPLSTHITLCCLSSLHLRAAVQPSRFQPFRCLRSVAKDQRPPQLYLFSSIFGL